MGDVWGWINVVLPLLGSAVLPWLIGRYVRLRADLAEAGWRHAKQLERERRLVVRELRLRERARIARDMHDSLGHELSLAAMRTGAAAGPGRRSPLSTVALPPGCRQRVPAVGTASSASGNGSGWSAARCTPASTGTGTRSWRGFHAPAGRSPGHRPSPTSRSRGGDSGRPGGQPVAAWPPPSPYRGRGGLLAVELGAQAGQAVAPSVVRIRTRRPTTTGSTPGSAAGIGVRRLGRFLVQGDVQPRERRLGAGAERRERRRGNSTASTVASPDRREPARFRKYSSSRRWSPCGRHPRCGRPG
ncbi:histidine kinase dimerization/phosphoacceptor domain-containing protein [Micromonospora sonneratiae]|uniref:histidine kinase n=1 Tax=Micromonospora sonneratiae TaxID=1184706 RepID=A0ABW3YKR9_9ACTN